jgi:multidrug transporter EmrE-like cation transporter
LRTAAALFIAAVVIASTGQILMKRGALRGRTGFIIRSFLDPFTIAGYALMLASTVVSTIALKVLPLKLTVSLQPLGFLVVVFLSVVLLHEKVQRHHIWGMLVILAGIVIFNLGAL